MNRTLLVLLVLLAAVQVRAHEFWLLPDRFQLSAPGSTVLSLAVGQEFLGERVAFTPSFLPLFQHISATGRADLSGSLAADTLAPECTVRLAQPGTHLIAISTAPSEIVLPAVKFGEYLQLEGLRGVLQERERTGRTHTPGRERFRRDVKTLVQVGPAGDATWAARTGQRLEILPLADPATLFAGQPLAFRLLFDGRPLPQALMKFWHRSGSELVQLAGTTDASGEVAFTPPEPGTWMASVVHMVRASDFPAHDWDSFWGNLTFGLPSGPLGAQGPFASSAPRR